jgi:hypothetical protein
VPTVVTHRDPAHCAPLLLLSHVDLFLPCFGVTDTKSHSGRLPCLTKGKKLARVRTQPLLSETALPFDASSPMPIPEQLKFPLLFFLKHTSTLLLAIAEYIEETATSTTTPNTPLPIRQPAIPSSSRQTPQIKQEPRCRYCKREVEDCPCQYYHCKYHRTRECTFDSE